jgi:hypothetical protein
VITPERRSGADVAKVRPATKAGSPRTAAQIPWYNRYRVLIGAAAIIIAALITWAARGKPSGASTIEMGNKIEVKPDISPTIHNENKPEFSPKVEVHTHSGPDKETIRSVVREELELFGATFAQKSPLLAGKQEPKPGDSEHRQDAIALSDKGYDAALKGEWSACVAHNDDALLLDPQFAAAYSNRGCAEIHLVLWPVISVTYLIMRISSAPALRRAVSAVAASRAA